ncbi:hypothetical protein KAU33_07560 [Candidatus Dependentiae bacterium]|nr:hypothetical protein [Candidatus Dependentiae bacterium]
MKKFFLNIVNLDRRWIFLMVAIVVSVPLFIPSNPPIVPARPVQELYDFIDALPEGSTIMVCFDYSPDSLAELNPMGRAICRHAFSKDINVIGMAFAWPSGSGLGQEVVSSAAKEYDKVQGKDWVYFGYKVGFAQMIIGMGKDIVKTVQADYRGESLKNMELFQEVKNYDDVSIVIVLAAGGTVQTYIYFVNTMYNRPVSAGVTAVMAADYYPYLQTGQLIGLLNGMKGAADYEKLINIKGLGTRGIPSQNWAHIMIIILIVVGNIAYLLEKKQTK